MEDTNAENETRVEAVTTLEEQLRILVEENANAENDIRIEETAIVAEQLGVPLLEDQCGTGKPQKTPAQRAIRKTFKGTAHLANLLPTGSVLSFQILAPAFTHEGQCHSIISKSMTLGLLGFCGISCFFLCFTDSIRDDRGKVRYGVATLRGLWVIDGSCVNIPPEDVTRYKLKCVDFVHAFMSIIVFVAVALFDENIVNCFYPIRSVETQELLKALPVAVGVICSLLFLAFPTKRHGIGFPLSRN